MTGATDLILCPATNTGEEATTYMMLWPHDGTYSILWAMWCSSRRWAIQDAACDFGQFFKEMFPEGAVVHYREFNSRKEIAETVCTMNLEHSYDLRRLAEVRVKWALPPWAPDRDDYRYVDYSRGMVK